MTTEPVLRVGTWNVLSFDDEYDSDFGCPLSIALCPEPNDTNYHQRRIAFTQQRQQRVWNQIESLFDQLDVICLQEVQEDFLSLHNTSTSHWTPVQQRTECAILLSQSAAWRLVVSFNVSAIPNLSGCAAVPMVVVQSSSYEASVLIGSVHVQASVTDMDSWYQTAWDAIVNSTLNHSSLEPQPLWVILAGDFNHNLTSPANNTSWKLIPVNSSDSILPGTTQKEYNWMGNFDGFLLSTAPLFAETTKGIPSFTATNVSSFVQGFMPKVVQGFLQGNEMQTSAQFALVIETEEPQNFTIWNASKLDDFRWNDSDTRLQLLVSSSRRFPSLDDARVVPNSNPFSETLSDHLLVTASFVILSNDTAKEAEDPPSVQQKKSTTSTSPLVWVGLVVSATFLVVLAWKMLSRRNARFDRLSQEGSGGRIRQTGLD